MSDVMKNKLAPLMIASAGCLWATLGIFVRRFDMYGVGSMSIVFLRAALTSAITAAGAAIFDREKLKIKLRDIWMFAGAGLMSLVFFNFCYFRAITIMPLSAAAILLYTSPVFVMLMSAVLFKERITGRKTLSAAMAIGGLVLVTGVIGDAGGMTPAGILYGLGSGFGYALYSIFGRAAINRGYGAVTMTCYSFAFAALFSALAADMGTLMGMMSESPSMIGFSVLFAVCVSVLPYILYSQGLKGTDNSTAAVIATVEPAAAALFGILLYKEIPTLSSGIGIIMVIAALIIAAMPDKKAAAG